MKALLAPRASRRALLSRLGRLAALSLLIVAGCGKQALATPKTYHATGEVRSFGPQRVYVNIAHDDIPGYMNAMTMSFEPENPSLLDGLEVGVRVSFDFYETADSRRVLTRIQRNH